MTLIAPPQAPADGVIPAPAAPRRKRRLVGTSPATRPLVSTVDLQRHRGAYFTVLGLTIAVFVLVFLLPLYWMFASAVKSPAEYALNTPTFIPHSWHPENYPTAWDNMRIAKYFTNTVLYATGGWLIALVFDVGIAYALSKLKPVFGKILLGAVLASLMLPASALLVPAYLTVVDVPLVHVNL